MTRQRLVLLSLGVCLALGAAIGLFRPPARPSAPGSDLLRQTSPTEVREEITRGAAPLTVVNFWASWCEPCKREFPHYLRLAREFKDRGVRLLFISVDDAADFEEAETFLRQNGVDFPTFYKGRQSLNFVAEIYPKWTGAVPATVLFGPDAGVLEAWEGDTSWIDLEKKVSGRLAKP